MMVVFFFSYFYLSGGDVLFLDFFYSISKGIDIFLISEIKREGEIPRSKRELKNISPLTPEKQSR